LIEAHIKQMARKVNELTNNEKWKENKPKLGEYRFWIPPWFCFLSTDSLL